MTLPKEHYEYHLDVEEIAKETFRFLFYGKFIGNVYQYKDAWYWETKEETSIPFEFYSDARIDLLNKKIFEKA